MSFVPDLPAWCDRIGHHGPLAATRAVLDTVIAAHVAAVPFENLDVLLGRAIDLDPVAVERKLVHAGRGGYCFELNTHLMRVLEAIGFRVTPLSARVRLQRTRDFTPARTHVFLRVETDEGPRLADVGVGGLTPTCSLALEPDRVQATPHEPRRLVREGDRWFHQALLGDAWSDVCEFTGEAMPEIDREVANWYTSTHPRSHFRDRLTVARATADGRWTLLDRTLTRRGPGGVTARQLDSADELLGVLAGVFGLHLPPGTRFSTPGLAGLA